MENLKKDIINLVSGIENQDELNNIYNYIHLTTIKYHVKQFLDLKGLGTKSNIEWLADLICFKSLSTIQEKIHFCNALLFENNLIPEHTLLFEGEKCLIENTRLNICKVFHDIKPYIMNKIDIEGMGNNNIGKGELFFVLFGKGTSKGISGDININGKEVEIKGIKARCRGMKGYLPVDAMSPVKHFKETLGIKLKTREMSFIKWEEFNNELIKSGADWEFIFEAFHSFFCGIYTDFEFDTIGQYWLHKILDEDTGLLHEDSIHYLTAMQIDYYKHLEGFESIMFIEPELFKGLVIHDGEEYMKYKNCFKIQQFAWTGKDNRSCVNSITYLG